MKETGKQSTDDVPLLKNDLVAEYELLKTEYTELQIQYDLEHDKVIRYEQDKNEAIRKLNEINKRPLIKLFKKLLEWKN